MAVDLFNQSLFENGGLSEAAAAKVAAMEGLLVAASSPVSVETLESGSEELDPIVELPSLDESTSEFMWSDSEKWWWLDTSAGLEEEATPREQSVGCSSCIYFWELFLFFFIKKLTNKHLTRKKNSKILCKIGKIWNTV